MDEEKEVKKRKRRKRSSPKTRLRYRGRLRRPGTAAAMKARWKDPEYRAKMAEVRKRTGGNTSREGIPDGMRKPEAMKLVAEAKRQARDDVSKLDEAGVFAGDDQSAKEALEVTLTIMRSPGDKKTRLSAAKQVLEYTKSKPASKVIGAIDTAEAWLKAIAEQNDDADQGEDAEDA